MSAAGTSGLYVNPNTGAAQAGLAPFRNAIINGDMRINQRGTSTNLASLSAVATASPGSWVADRWNVLRGVAGAVMGQGTNLTTTDLPFSDAGIKTFGRVGRVNSNVATDQIKLTYNMESQDSIKYAGKFVTLSFYYRTGANFNPSSFYIAVYTGTGTDENLRGNITGLLNPLYRALNSSTSWTKISATFNVSSSLNQIFIQFGYNPTGTAGAADYFDITGVQLELGSVATPFEVRPYPVELQLCQRYYVRWVAQQPYSHFPLSGFVGGTNTIFVGTIITQTNLRVAPSSSSQFSNSGTFIVLAGSGMSVSSIALDLSSSSLQCFRINITGSAGVTGQSGILRAENSAGSYIAIDVEL